RFPDVIELPKPPCIAVDSIEYVDGNGVLQTLDASKYEVDKESEPARIKPIGGWPYVNGYNAVIVTFGAGYSGDSIALELPKQIKQAILLMTKHFFDNRDTVIVSDRLSIDTKEVPMTAN